MPELDEMVRAAASALMAREARGPVLVGLSGGADSQALLHLLRRWAAEGIELHAIHVDHGLRPDSAADAARVAALCAEWQVPLVVERVAIDQGEAGRLGGVEQAARRERYRAFAAAAGRLGAAVLALGHQRDDQAETVLLHLLRGAGLAGLRGMAVVARSGTALDEFAPDPASRPALWRPILQASRDEIAAYCRRNGLCPLVDLTNDDLSLRRNAVRNAVFPVLEAYFPQARASLARATRLLADEDAALEAVVADHWARVVRWRDGVASVDRAAFRGLLPAIQRRLLRRAWEQTRSGPAELPADVVELVCRQAEGGRTGSRLALPGGVCCVLDAAEAHLGSSERLEERLAGFLGLPLVEDGWCPRSVGVDGAGAVELRGGWRIEIRRATPGAARPEDAGEGEVSPALHIPRDLLAEAGGRLVLRTWEEGDWVLLPGGRGRQKLQDWLVNRRLPRYVRRRLVLATLGKRVLWVAGVASFLSEPKDLAGPSSRRGANDLLLKVHRAVGAQPGAPVRHGPVAGGATYPNKMKGASEKWVGVE